MLIFLAMEKNFIEKGIADVIATYELLDKVRLGQDVTLRDDQFDYEVLLDAAKYAHRKGFRIKLLDTGRFSPAELEWLIREKVRLYTSGEARSDEFELVLLLKACRRARSFLSYFENQSSPGDGEKVGLALSSLSDLVSSGMDIHLSNRDGGRDFERLTALAESAEKGKSFCVYYHHGPPVSEIGSLAARGAWIHLSDRNLSGEEDAAFLLKLALAARERGSRIIVHVDKGLPIEMLTGLWNAGAALLFNTPPSDEASLQRPLERRAPRRRLPVRASYLTPMLLP